MAIATGNRTGDAIPAGEIAAIRSGTTLPVIGGSGMTLANVEEILPLLDGAVIGSSLKHEGVWWNPAERDRVTALVDRVAIMRKRHEIEGSV